MAELCETTGVPVPTIKYYLREGLLAPGRPVGRNQADYGPEHVKRLRLVRALIEYGGLGIAAIRELTVRLDNPGVALFELMGEAQKTVTTHDDPRPGPVRDRAERIVAELLERKGWQDAGRNPAIGTLVGVLAVLDELGRQDMVAALGDYADAAERVAEVDLRVMGAVEDREQAVEIVALGTRLGDAIVGALRRVAQEHMSQRAFDF
ncbi:MerR family transcriptional regulator [Nonomuraea endophytica]|nr:MerR family transcriptional regulator [Nonomuraea endophytica]